MAERLHLVFNMLHEQLLISRGFTAHQSFNLFWELILNLQDVQKMFSNSLSDIQYNITSLRSEYRHVREV